MAAENHVDAHIQRQLRVRNNKRRSRARQKEHIAGLQHKLAVARELGVQASKEVQVAAQKVVEENVRLKNFLGSLGYTNKNIDDIVNGGIGGSHFDKFESRFMDITLFTPEDSRTTLLELIPGQLAACQSSGEEGICKRVTGNSSVTLPKACSRRSSVPNHEQQQHIVVAQSCQDIEASRAHSEAVNKPPTACTIPENSGLDTLGSQSIEQTKSPCRLLTYLQENPAADLTLPAKRSASEEVLSGSDKAIACRSAYSIAIARATSTKKMEQIALALENGCIKTAGGCAVESSTVWKILDDTT